MTGPITTDDLYGTSDEKPSDEVQTVIPQEIHKGVPVEETPEITKEVESEESRKQAREGGARETKSERKSSGCAGVLGKIVLFLLLVAAGVWGANAMRQYLPTGALNEPSIMRTTPSPTLTDETSLPGAFNSPSISDWKTYDVISGTTKLPLGGVTFKLPPDVLSPICDGTSCSSQGTYLPGGTRFTVAARGVGQLLADYRGTAIADTRGTIFTTKQTTVAGLPALEFSGSFTGGTVSGYSFTSMRGVMIALTPTTSLEINHFTPNGIVADFTSDDALFDEILKTVTVVP